MPARKTAASGAADTPAGLAAARSNPADHGGPASQDHPAARSNPAREGLPDGRDLAAVRAFIERFTSQLTAAGFPRTPARIFVALLTSDSSRFTAAELGALLQTSPASVSGGVRYLIQVGLVVAEGEPGSKRQHYRMPDDVWQDIVRLRDRQFSRWAAELRDGVAVLGPATPAGVRLAHTVRYFEFISQEMSQLLARWEQEQARP